jgi:hypothetical protein
MLSLNRTPSRCVLDLNSIRLKSFKVGLVGDFPNTVNKPAARKLKNEFIFVRIRIFKIRDFTRMRFTIYEK